MDCNKCTSWDEYSDLSDEESKQNEDQLIIDAKIHLFLRKYTSFPLDKEKLIEVFVQSNFDEEAINLILEKKLIEKQKNKKNLIKENDQREAEEKEKEEEEKNKNQSKIDSWKENKDNRYKKPKYKSHNYNSNYNNHSNNFFYYNKKHFKDYKTYKIPYNHQSNSNNYHMNNGNNRNNFIEKEVELNIKGENEGEIVDENIRHNSLDSNSKNNLVFNNQNNIEDINSLEYLNLDLVKSQSEEINHKDVFNFHDIGIKLFPGAFRYNKKKNYEQNIFDGNSNINNNLIEENKKADFTNDNLRNKNDLECNNYLCKANSNTIKSEQRNGLSLAYDYYCSFLGNKIK